jgi:hypothetical protein
MTAKKLGWLLESMGHEMVSIKHGTEDAGVGKVCAP